MQLIFPYTVLYLQLVIVTSRANRFKALANFFFFWREEKGIDSAVISVCLVLPGLSIFCYAEKKVLLGIPESCFSCVIIERDLTATLLCKNGNRNLAPKNINGKQNSFLMHINEEVRSHIEQLLRSQLLVLWKAPLDVKRFKSKLSGAIVEHHLRQPIKALVLQLLFLWLLSCDSVTAGLWWK